MARGVPPLTPRKAAEAQGDLKESPDKGHRFERRCQKGGRPEPNIRDAPRANFCRLRDPP